MLGVSDEDPPKDAAARDRAASRRDIDAGVRDRMAGEDMTDSERSARREAAKDRLDAMRDRQAAARERDRPADAAGPDD